MVEPALAPEREVAVFPRIARFDRQLAVVIGIDRYRVERFRLTGAVADAEAVADVLGRHHGYEVHLVRDRDATQGALARLFGWQLRRRVTTKTQLLIYFAGHGLAHASVEHGLDGYLLPVDATVDRRNWLPMRFVRERLAALPCHHLLVILDCCFAGAFAQRFRDVEFADARLYREQYDHYLDRRACQLLASSAHDERALDRLGRERAPFGRTLVGALERQAADDPRADLDRDGVITAPDLYGYLRKQLAVLPGVAQTPNLWPLAGHDVGEYVFTLAEPRLDRAPKLEPGSNPYRGLRYFRFADAGLFKGRDSFVRLLADRAASEPVTALLGPSGSGKSSVLHAGLHPALDRAGIRVLGPLRPGPQPVLELARLGGGTTTAGDGRACLIVDQLDELVGARPEQRELFQMLLALVVPGAHIERARAAVLAAPPRLKDAAWAAAIGLERLRGRASLVLGIRSDAEPHFCSERTLGAMLGELWGPGRVVLPAMNREELRECIEGPLAEPVVFFTAAPPPKRRRDGRHRLVDVILDEVEQMPQALPLLSVALERMFESFYRRAIADRRIRTIDWCDYPDPGGVVGALQHKAEQLFLRGAPEDREALPPRELEPFQHTLRRVLLRMIAWRGRTPVRHRIARDDLAWPDPDETRRATHVIEVLLAERLISQDVDATDPASAGAAVEPAHDALLTGWPRLQKWLDQDREQIILHSEIQAAAREWKRGGKARELLWDDRRVWRFDGIAPEQPMSTIRRITRWLWDRGWATYPISQIPPHAFTTTERAFFGESLKIRRRRRTWIGAVIAAVVAVLAGASFITYRQRNAEAVARRRAEAEVVRANDRVRLRAVRTVIDADPTTAAAILKEVQRPDLAPGWRDYAVQVLGEGVAAARLELADARVVETAGGHVLLRAGTGMVIWKPELRRSFAFTGRAQLSPSGTHALSFPDRAPVELWDVVGETRLATAPPGHREGVLARDGSRLVSYGGRAHEAPVLWNTDRGVRIETLAECGAVDAVRFVIDGAVLTFAFGARACLWDGTTGALRASLAMRKESSGNFVVSPRETRIATFGSRDGFPAALQLWDSRDGRLVATLDPPDEHLDGLPEGVLPGSEAVIFAPDDSRVVTVGHSKLVLWDAATGARLAVIPRRAPATIAFTADSLYLVVHATSDRTAAVWHARDGRRLLALPPSRRVDLSPDGTRAALEEDDGFALVEVATGRVLARRRGRSAVWSRDGARLAISDEGPATIAILDARTGTGVRAGSPTQRVDEQLEHAHGAFSPDGAIFATEDRASPRDPTTPRVGDAATGRLLLALPEGMSLGWAAMIADQQMIAANRTVVELWRTREQRRVYGRVIASTAHRAVIEQPGQDVELRDLATWARLGAYPTAGRAHAIELSPDRERLAILSDAELRLVEMQTGSVRSVKASCIDAAQARYTTRVGWTAAPPRLVIGADNRGGCVIDLDAGGVVAELPAMRWYVLPEHGRRMIAALATGAVELRELDAGTIVARFADSATAAAAFSDDGAAFALDRGSGLEVCDAATGTLCRRVGPPGEISAIAFAHVRDRLVARSADGAHRLIDTRTGATLAELGRACGSTDCPVPALQREAWVPPPTRPLAPRPFAALLADPPRVAIPELDGMWDARTGAPITLGCRHGVFGGPLFAMTFTRDGRRLKTADCLLDSASGRLIAKGSWLTPDERYLIAAGGFALLDPITGLPVRALDRQLGNVRAFAPDASALVETDLARLRVWSLTTPDAPVVTVALHGPLWESPTVSHERLVFADLAGLHDVPLTIDELGARLDRATAVCLSVTQRRDLLEETAAQARDGLRRCQTRTPR